MKKCGKRMFQLLSYHYEVRNSYCQVDVVVVAGGEGGGGGGAVVEKEEE